MNRTILAVSALVGGVCLGVPLSVAQEVAQDDEIVVTAQRREQALSDVPATVSAFSGGDLQELGVTQTSDIGQLTPNLTITGAYAGSSNPVITIRGVGLSDFNDNNSSPAGGYVDEVYFVSPPMLAFSLFDAAQSLGVMAGPLVAGVSVHAGDYLSAALIACAFALLAWLLFAVAQGAPPVLVREDAVRG